MDVSLFRCLALHFGADIEALERVCQELKTKLEEFTEKIFDAGVLIFSTNVQPIFSWYQVQVEKFAQNQKKIVRGQILFYTHSNTWDQPMGVYLEAVLKKTVLFSTLLMLSLSKVGTKSVYRVQTPSTPL